MRTLRRRFLPLLAVVMLLCAAMTVPALAAGEDPTELAGTKYIECPDCGTSGVVLSGEGEAVPCETCADSGYVGYITSPSSFYNTALSLLPPVIAIALACNPALLIADEPTTALDVTIQAQILDLMKKLQKEDQSSILLITHDLGVVAEMCSRVIVMYAGKIVEEAPVKELFASPAHPYTQGLIASVPKLGSGVKVLPSIPGSVPDLASMPKGCRFAPRCKYATAKCHEKEPELVTVGENQRCRCWLKQEG